MAAMVRYATAVAVAAAVAPVQHMAGIIVSQHRCRPVGGRPLFKTKSHSPFIISAFANKWLLCVHHIIIRWGWRSYYTPNCIFTFYISSTVIVCTVYTTFSSFSNIVKSHTHTSNSRWCMNKCVCTRGITHHTTAAAAAPPKTKLQKVKLRG